MGNDWSTFKARINNRLARHLRKAPLRLRNKHPIVSFTFDDAPESAATSGVAILDYYNAKATFYVAGGLVGQWSGHWQGISKHGILELHRRGHEIACHTFSHRAVPDLAADRLADEIEQNRRYLLALDPSIQIENFAYPYGMGSVLRKTQLARTFRSARGIIPGANHGVVDLQFLRSTPLINRNIDFDGIDRAFDEAIETNGWLIFYGHDVAGDPSPYGCTPELLRHALDAASRRGVAIMTVADALDACGSVGKIQSETAQA
jgi:peptidoglycan/xylan/chitin deacetylase (PgdA/CDA1 family)